MPFRRNVVLNLETFNRSLTVILLQMEPVFRFSSLFLPSITIGMSILQEASEHAKKQNTKTP